jgi:hypothetical protein
MDAKEIIPALVVIRSTNIDRAALFYEAAGMNLTKHAHGSGPEHYTAMLGDLVFELYPAQNQESSAGVRLGFKVSSVKNCVEAIRKLNGKVVSEPALRANGFSATVQDFDGHKVELSEKS